MPRARREHTTVNVGGTDQKRAKPSWHPCRMTIGVRADTTRVTLIVQGPALRVLDSSV